MDAYASTGIFGFKDMPEDLPPKGVEHGSLEHVLFITLTVAIDYQRDATVLWDASRRSYEDTETRYLFDPRLVHEARAAKVLEDMRRYGLSKKPKKDAWIWRTVAVTFHKKWGGDPRRMLEHLDWDAPRVLASLRDGRHAERNKQALDFPYLGGKKIGPLWLRMLRDNVGISKLRNMDQVDLPIDVHVARATLCLGVIRGKYEGDLETAYEKMRRAWAEAVRGLRHKKDERQVIALDLDEALWGLSRYGCTHRNVETGACPKFDQCPMRELCWRGSIQVGSSGIKMDS
ncbi:MAG: hypothetical protein M5U26_11785 [Planctomycetota bacterium]|nr:hypothetical protein [Planctomycetota bacterium]